MSWWHKIFRARAESWYFAPLAAEHLPRPVERRPIEPESGYLNAFLTSMHISDVRVATQTFYGAVTSSFTVATRSGGTAEFVVVTTPEVLKNIDPKHLDRVITVDKRLLGPVPYRGSDLDVELGLFAMPAADLLEPYLDVVESISKISGVNLVTAAAQLVPTVKSALTALLGAADTPRLEIGVSTTFAVPSTGYYCAVRADRDDPALADIGLGPDSRLVHADGKEVDSPYLVFQLTCTRQRDDWAEIPEVQMAYQEIGDAVRRGDLLWAKEALAVFGRTAILCPDLLAADGQRLHELVVKEVDLAFPDALTSASAPQAMPELKTLPLF